MNLVELVRLFNGYVKFGAEGGFGERFVNLCEQRRLGVRSLAFDDERLEGFVTARDYIKLRTVAKQSGMKLRCISKHGLPFFMFKNRNRVGLAVGAAFFVLFMSIMSLFVWNIETVGSENISSTEILSVAQEYGLRLGCFRPTLDVHEVADKMITKLNGRLLWVAVNVSGSRAVIEARDYIEKPESKTYSDPCNIVADFDGLLLSLEVHNGTKANFEGNGVKKGDLLISGIVENRDFSSSFHEARGKITALHSDTVSAEIKHQSDYKVFTATRSVYSVRFFWLKIPLGFFKNGGDYDEFKTESVLELGNHSMPFSVEKRTRAYYTVQSGSTGFEKEDIFDEYTRASYEKYKNTNVLKTELKVDNDAEKLMISGKSRCIDFIGIEQKIKFEN